MEIFLSKSEKLVRENEQLKIKIQGLITENRQLQSTLQNITNNTLEETKRPVSSFPLTTSILPHALNEQEFRADLLQKEHRTSSPVDFKSFIQSSAYVEPSEDDGFESNASYETKEEAERLLGEIAYQLDRRILSYVFPSNKRFYGYNVTNIPSKIIEVTTNLVTGRVDEDYRLHVIRRYDDIKDTLSQLGYKITLHPQFSEFVVNTYGILMMRPKEGSSQTMYYNNPTYLKTIVTTTANSKLQKDLLLLLNCLCTLAQRDGKPLFLW